MGTLISEDQLTRASQARYDAFISYSHADVAAAVALQSALQRFARPWNKRRALAVFRDEAALSIVPSLWTSVSAAMDESRYLVVVASPAAAKSGWVDTEIRHWLATRPVDTVLPVVVAGAWEWDHDAGDFAAHADAVPPALRGLYRDEPRYLDLRWAAPDELTLRHPRFRGAVAELAAPIHDVPRDELESEELRLFRRARKLRAGAVTGLCTLAVAALVAGSVATVNARRAQDALADADASARRAVAEQTRAERAAQEAARQEEVAERQRAAAGAAAEEARRQESLAQSQRAKARAATMEAQRQEQLAGVASQRASDARAEAAHQQKLAEQQEEVAREAAAEAERQQAAARAAERAAADARREAERQRAIADEQARRADQEAARARQTTILADVRRINGIADVAMSDRMDRSLLLSLAALDLAHTMDSPETVDSEGVLLRGLEFEPRLQRYLRASGPPITAVDADRPVTGDATGEIAVLDAPAKRYQSPEPRPIRRLSALGDRIYALRDTGDGSELVVLDERDMTPVGAPIPADTFAPDHSPAASGLVVVARGRSIQVWRPGPTPQAIGSPRILPGTVTAVAIDGEDGLRLSAIFRSPAPEPSGGEAKDVIVWEVPDDGNPGCEEVVDRCTATGQQLTHATFGNEPSGRVAGMHWPGTVSLWTRGGDTQPMLSIPAPADARPVSFSLSNAAVWLQVGYSDGSVRSGALTSWKEHRIRGVAGAVTAVGGRLNFRPANAPHRLYTGNELGQVVAWNLVSRSRLSGGVLPELIADWAGERVVAVPGDKGLVGRFGSIRWFPTDDYWDIKSFADSPWFDVSPDGRLLAIAGEAARRTVFHRLDGSGDPPPQPLPVAGPVSFAPGSSAPLLVVSGVDGRPSTVWNVTTHRRVARVSGTHAAFAGRDTLATVTGNRVALWDLRDGGTGNGGFTLLGDRVTALAADPQGERIVAGTTTSSRGESVERLEVLDLTDGRQRPITTDAPNLTLAFSPDGSKVGSGGRSDATLWDARSWFSTRLRVTPRSSSPSDDVVYVSFEPGGSLLTSAGSVQRWRFDRESLRAAACAVVGRNLTPDEWDRFVGAAYRYRRQC